MLDFTLMLLLSDTLRLSPPQYANGQVKSLLCISAIEEVIVTPAGMAADGSAGGAGGSANVTGGSADDADQSGSYAWDGAGGVGGGVGAGRLIDGGLDGANVAGRRTEGGNCTDGVTLNYRWSYSNRRVVSAPPYQVPLP